MPRIAPAKIPDFAAISTTLKFVCVLVAPNARLPSSSARSTELIAVMESEVIVGKIMMANSSTTARKEFPPAVDIPMEDASDMTSVVIAPAANTP